MCIRDSIDPVQVAQGCHAGLHAVQTGMSQLVLAAGTRHINVVIAGGVDERHPFGGGVDHLSLIHISISSVASTR